MNGNYCVVTSWSIEHYASLREALCVAKRRWATGTEVSLSIWSIDQWSQVAVLTH